MRHLIEKVWELIEKDPEGVRVALEEGREWVELLSKRIEQEDTPQLGGSGGKCHEPV
jgi:hypothetical protein